MYIPVIEDRYAIVEGGTWVFVKRGELSINTEWQGYWFICWCILQNGSVDFCGLFWLFLVQWVVSCVSWAALYYYLNSFWMQLLLCSCLKTSYRSLEGDWIPCVYCDVCLSTKQRNWAFLGSWGSAWLELTLWILPYSQICLYSTHNCLFYTVFWIFFEDDVRRSLNMRCCKTTILTSF